MIITVSLIQMDVALGRPQDNLDRVQERVAQAAKAGATLVVLPELWGSGYDLASAGRYADELESGLFAEMSALAKTRAVYLAGSLLERKKGSFFNTAFLYDPDGVLRGHYRKTHLFRLMDEDLYLGAGNAMPVFDMPWGRTALAICYDLRFPELFRHYACQGAIFTIIPAQWPARRVVHWRALLQARAIENQMIIAACNRVGQDGDEGESFSGHSVLCDAWGQRLIEGKDREALLTASVDFATVTQARSFIPVFDDRRSDLYG